MMLVLAGLILAAAAIVSMAHIQLRVSGGPVRHARPPRHPLGDSLKRIAGTPYLRLIAATLFLAAITTQWTGFQLSLAASQRFHDDADALTRFFGTFNFALGLVSFVLQLALVGPTLRKFGLAVTILVLPLAIPDIPFVEGDVNGMGDALGVAHPLEEGSAQTHRPLRLVG